jgi:peroxiredoxin Q/BCP
MGIDRSTFLIQDGVVKRIWRKVKVANHAADVLAAVEAL